MSTRKPPNGERTPSTDGKEKNSKSKPPAGKDPDLYDPVGMAGKKAGIIDVVNEAEGESSDAPNTTTNAK